MFLSYLNFHIAIFCRDIIKITLSNSSTKSLPYGGLTEFAIDQDSLYYGHGNSLAGLGSFDAAVADPPASPVSFVNLYAVQDGNVQAATINQLRLAFQIQKFYEQQARDQH